MKNKSIIIWAFVYTIIAAFIFVFSYLYPYGADEYLYTFNCHDIIGAIKFYFHSYLFNNPRIGLLANNIILSQGKWLFLILNPLMQIAIISSIFFLIYSRKPNFKTLTDMPAFILITIMSIFFVAKPDNTIFWIGGACNYSWSILPFLWLLIFLKHIYETKSIPQFGNISLCLLFPAAIALGMSNENNAIAALLLLLVFVIFCLKTKIKITMPIKLILLGTIIGIILLFYAPGSYKRAAHPLLSFFNEASIIDKIIWHIPKINDLFVNFFLIPLIIPVLLLLELYSTKLKAVRNYSFDYSVISYAIGCFLAALLAGAPILGNTRPFYSASIMWVISFIFMLKYFQEIYKIKLIYYASWCAFILFIFIMPLFSIQYISLYKQDRERTSYIQKTKEQGKNKLYLAFLLNQHTLTKNLNISYYDILLNKNANKLLGMDIEIINNQDNKLNII